MLVAVGGLGVGSALQASMTKSAIEVAASMSRRLIFNSDLLPRQWLRVEKGYYTLDYGVEMRIRSLLFLRTLSSFLLSNS